MTTIKLFANDQQLYVAEPTKLASGDRESVVLVVQFSRHWSDYEKSAVFFTSADDTVYEVLLSGGQCVIPHEVLATPGYLFIGIRGVNTDVGSVKTSTLIKHKVEKGAPVGTGTSLDPTPDVYQQILAKLVGIQNTVDAVEKGKSAYEIAVDNGFEGSESEWLDSLKGEPGENGYTPVKGVDYFDGANGKDGKDGINGKDGKDYVLTDADKQEIVQMVLAELGDTGGGNWLFKDETFVCRNSRYDLPDLINGVSYTCFVDGKEVDTQTPQDSECRFDFGDGMYLMWTYFEDQQYWVMWGESDNPRTISIRINENIENWLFKDENFAEDERRSDLPVPEVGKSYTLFDGSGAEYGTVTATLDDIHVELILGMLEYTGGAWHANVGDTYSIRING